MPLQSTANRVDKLLAECDNLVALHEFYGRPTESRSRPKGRRRVETSANRAVVVMSVAGWQAAVEGIVESAVANLRSMQPETNPAWQVETLCNIVDAEVRKFSTANSTNSRVLAKRVGINLDEDWRNDQDGVTKKLDEWLQVRHSIAHGDPQPPRVEVLRSVKQGMAPTIRLVDATDCLKFFRALAQVTVDSAAEQMGVDKPKWIHSTPKRVVP